MSDEWVDGPLSDLTDEVRMPSSMQFVLSDTAAADASTSGSPADLPVGARGGAESTATTRVPETGVQRSIAEIIGWRKPHYATHVVPKPTPDDMLAWLVAKLAPSRYISMYGREERGGWCALITNPQSVFAEYCAPTLREALEAAVRAVAGET